jgi:hypothetical protein
VVIMTVTLVGAPPTLTVTVCGGMTMVTGDGSVEGGMTMVHGS